MSKFLKVQLTFSTGINNRNKPSPQASYTDRWPPRPAKLMPTSADRGYGVVSAMGPSAVNLSFLYRIRCLFIQVASQLSSRGCVNPSPDPLVIKTKFRSPRANYTDWATATCRRNIVPTFVDRGVSRGQRGGSPTVLSFLDRSRYFSFK
jgi:hypothetical protein